MRIDSGPPAKFTPILQPTSIDVAGQTVLTFRTTDGISGIDHYEVKLISEDEQDGVTTIFTEQTSPYVLRGLGKGKYKVLVRAFDNAGNYTDGEASLLVTSLFLGLSLGNLLLIIGGLFLAILLALLLLWYRRRHHYVTLKQVSSDLTNVRQQMKQKWEELRALKQVENQSVETITEISNTPPEIINPQSTIDQNSRNSPDPK